MANAAQQPVNNNQLNNARVNGFTINTLNSMVYENLGYVEDNEFEYHTISCSYRLPQSIELDRYGLTVMSFNIRSLNSNFDNFKAEILHYGKTLDIIGFCETRLTNDTEQLYKLPGYNLHCANVASDMGGVCIYVKDSINCKLRKDLELIKYHIELMFIECIIDNKVYLIGMVYRRPGSSINRFMEDLEMTLDKINQNCILMGDYNINLLNTDNNQVQNLVNVMTQYSYYSVINKPTRVYKNSATIIDHMWVNFDLCNSCHSSIVFCGITDHFPIILNLKNVGIKCPRKVISYRRSGDYFDELFRSDFKMQISQ